MSRAFELSVTIKLNDLVNWEKVIKQNLSGMYDFKWERIAFRGMDKILVGFCEIAIGFTQSEEEVARALAVEAFKANDGPLDIVVRTTCLEDMPFEEFEYGKQAYKDYKKLGLLK